MMRYWLFKNLRSKFDFRKDSMNIVSDLDTIAKIPDNLVKGDIIYGYDVAEDAGLHGWAELQKIENSKHIEIRGRRSIQFSDSF